MIETKEMGKHIVDHLISSQREMEDRFSNLEYDLNSTHKWLKQGSNKSKMH